MLHANKVHFIQYLEAGEPGRVLIVFKFLSILEYIKIFFLFHNYILVPIIIYLDIIFSRRINV